jgi:hypothetical protein
MKLIIIVFNKIIFAALLFLCFSARVSLAATGCDLNDPDRDVPRLFPESTSYKTKYVSIKQLGGELLLKKIEHRLGEGYLALYAPIDTPYTLYEIYKGDKVVGYIHGVNQKGRFGGIQVFMAQDMKGRVKSFYLQRISGQMANKLRDTEFCRKFIGITIKDFDTYDPAIGKGSGRIAQIQNPSSELETDFYGVLRGLKKNLILMDEFIYSRQSVSTYEEEPKR